MRAASRTRLKVSANVNDKIVVVAAPDVRPVCRGSENGGRFSDCGRNSQESYKHYCLCGTLPNYLDSGELFFLTHLNGHWTVYFLRSFDF